MSAAHPYNLWLHRFALVTSLATLALILIGGLVTSHGAGMAVPDWPNSYGYNMFLFPISQWMGGILYEHTHRLVATFVGVLVVALTRWLGGTRSRLPLILTGLTEIGAGLALLYFAPDWKGAGHFLSGIGAIVFLAGVVWAKSTPAQSPLPLLGWLAFVTVQVQGLLGGLRVVLYKNELGIFHATLAQLFFVLLCTIALLTSNWWHNRAEKNWVISPGLRRAVLITTMLIFGQLMMGATMRHQHAGLAIPDFPLAYGKLWPAMDPDSIARYNQARMETSSINAVTSFQIGLQMAHRLLAVLILTGVGISWWIGRQGRFGKLAGAWLALVLVQASLGASTIWSNKAADVATAHVLAGALCFVMGALFTILTFSTSPSLNPSLESARTSVPLRASHISG